MDADFCVQAWEAAIQDHGCPQIFNTDQGTQFTSTAWLAVLKNHDIQISMDGRGLRKRNVTDLEWSQVDLQRNVAWIHADQAKARKSIHISLNATAMGVLRKQVGKHSLRVFTYQGKPII